MAAFPGLLSFPDRPAGFPATAAAGAAFADREAVAAFARVAAWFGGLLFATGGTIVAGRRFAGAFATPPGILEFVILLGGGAVVLATTTQACRLGGAGCRGPGSRRLRRGGARRRTAFRGRFLVDGGGAGDGRRRRGGRPDRPHARRSRSDTSDRVRPPGGRRPAPAAPVAAGRVPAARAVEPAAGAVSPPLRRRVHPRSHPSRDSGRHRAVHGHLGFCPAFGELPEVHVETPYDGVEAVVAAAEVVPWGVRIECRLAEPAEEAITIPVLVLATARA